MVAVASPVTILLYWWDKRAARLERRRVAEQTLHLWALAGGWPGALWARQKLRHKTQKQPFGWILWGTVLVNLALGTMVVWWATS